MSVECLRGCSDKAEQHPQDDKMKPWEVCPDSEHWSARHNPDFRQKDCCSCSRVRKGDVLEGFAIQLGTASKATDSDDIIILGDEGILVQKHCWAFSFEFEFDPPLLEQLNPLDRYNILLSSYRNNTIVAKTVVKDKEKGWTPETKMFGQISAAETERRQLIKKLTGKPDEFAKKTPKERKEIIEKLLACEELKRKDIGKQRLKQEEGESDEEFRRSLIQLIADERYPRGLVVYFIHADWYTHSCKKLLTKPRDLQPYRMSDFIPMTHRGWYSLMIRGEGSSNKESDVDHGIAREQKVLSIRIDSATDKHSDMTIREKKSEPHYSSRWTGFADFENIYSLGNIYDKDCCSTQEHVSWCLGAFRNVAVISAKKADGELFRQWPDDFIAPPQYEEQFPEVDGGRQNLLMKRRTKEYIDETTEGDDQKMNLRHIVDKSFREPMGKFQLQDGSSLFGESNKASITIVGLYRIVARIHVKHNRLRNTTRRRIRLWNLWNEDNEPGFGITNKVVNRDAKAFRRYKRSRTAAVLRALMDSTKKDMSRKDIKDTDKFSPYDMFVMRNRAARTDPGLHSLMTGVQLQAIIRHSHRKIKVNIGKMRKLLLFATFPFQRVYYVITRAYDQRTVTGRKKISNLDWEEIGPMGLLLSHMRRQGKLDEPWRFNCAQVTVPFVACTGWILVFVVLFWDQLTDVQGKADSLEKTLSIVFYCWAVAVVAIDVSSEIPKLPADNSFKVSRSKAKLAAAPVRLKDTTDGKEMHVSGVGFLIMVCRLNPRDTRLDSKDVERDEDDDLDEDGLGIGRSVLESFWQQRKVTKVLPWLADIPDFDPGTLEPIDLVREFQVPKENSMGQVSSIGDWEERNRIRMQSMEAHVHMGRPRTSTTIALVMLAFVNASIGILHRVMLQTRHGHGIEELKEELVDLQLISCCVLMFFGSFIVYKAVLGIAFKWFTFVLYSEQMGAALQIDTAMNSCLPCYIDLRIEGNLESWYNARVYLNTFGTSRVFGFKAQLTVAMALVSIAVTAAVMIGSIALGYRDDDASKKSPLAWYCTVNMIIMAFVSLIALFALERINHGTVKLLRKLDLVAIDVSRTSAFKDVIDERLEGEGNEQKWEQERQARLQKIEDQKANLQKLVNKRMEKQQHGRKKPDKQKQGKWNGEEHHDDTHGALQDMGGQVEVLLEDLDAVRESQQNRHLLSKKMLEHSKLAADYRYLQNIVIQLRDQATPRKLFGLAVNKELLAKIASGFVTILGIVLQQAVAQLVDTSAQEAETAAQDAAGQGSIRLSECGLTDSEQTAVNAVIRSFNASCGV